MKKLFLFFVLSIYLTSLTACGPTSGVPLHQVISDIRVSPDGNKIAFAYRYQNSSSTSNYIVYTINANGSQLTEVARESTPDWIYNVFQWTSNETILTTNSRALYEINTKTHTQKVLLKHPDKAENGDSSFAKQIRSVCLFEDPRYIFVHHFNGYPIWLDTQADSQGKFPSKEVFLPDADKNYYGLRNFLCSNGEHKVYVDGILYSDGNKIQTPFAATVRIDPSTGNTSSLQHLPPPKYVLDLIGWASTNSVMYLGSSDSLVYPKLGSKRPEKMFEYNIETQAITELSIEEGQKKLNPKQSKIFFVERSDSFEEYLCVSNLDGTNKKRLLTVQSLPKGDLPI